MQGLMFGIRDEVLIHGRIGRIVSSQEALIIFGISHASHVRLIPSVDGWRRQWIIEARFIPDGFPRYRRSRVGIDVDAETHGGGSLGEGPLGILIVSLGSFVGDIFLFGNWMIGLIGGAVLEWGVRGGNEGGRGVGGKIGEIRRRFSQLGIRA